MEKAVLRVRRLMSCLGDPSRFRLVRTLLERERCVTELAAAVGLSQSCTTRHLQALQREGLVRGKRDGKRVMFRLCLDEPRASALLRWATQARFPDAARGERAARAPAPVGVSRAAGSRQRSRARARPARPRPVTARPVIPFGAERVIEDVIQAPFDDAPDLVSPSAPTVEEDAAETPSRPRAPRQELEDYLL
jgi:DNA-binding transcriptional ArsR family regulator